MNELVSIIVPVYNAEKYLGKCIESIINQTYKNIEAIFVNDGSKDDSLSICKNYANQDKRIKILDIPNGGVSNARNVGIENAQGEYVQFIDSDDYIDLNMTERLMSTMLVDNVDLVVCGYNTIIKGEKRENQSKIKYSSKKLIDEDIDITNLFETSFFNSPCNKLYKKKLITNRFREDFKIGEDLLFNLDYINNVNRFSVLDECLYNYVVNNSSATNTISADKMFKQIELFNITSKWFKDTFNNSNIDTYWDNFMASSIINMHICYTASEDNYKVLKNNTTKLLYNTDSSELIKLYKPCSIEHKFLRRLFLNKRCFLMIAYGRIRKTIKQIYYKIIK